jgi:hypothetical protein
MDNFNGVTVHLNHRDITMVAVSRALSGDRRLQEAHGLGLPLALVGRRRLQLRLPRLLNRGRTGRRARRLQLPPEPLSDVGGARCRRLPVARREVGGRGDPGRAGGCVP